MLPAWIPLRIIAVEIDADDGIMPMANGEPTICPEETSISVQSDQTITTSIFQKIMSTNL